MTDRSPDNSPASQDQPVVELYTNPDENPSADRLQVAVESVLGSVFTEGNQIDVLRNGDEIFPAMLAAIEQAEDTIDFVTFVYWTGDIAQRFAAALAERARAGVRVRIILDGFGSLPMNQELVDEMRSAGAVVERFRPIVRWKFWESDHRTHRKILVCDNTVAFTGGVGIAEEWTGDARGPHEWRDTHFRVQGPAILGLRAAFLTDWRDAGHRIDRADIGVQTPDPAGSTRAAIVDGSAQIGLSDAERLLEAAFAAAEKRITIQTPYFNPTPELIDALVEARRRRVEIDILVPGPHIDKRISEVVARDRYFPLLDEGIRVLVYQPAMMHVKAVMVDDELAIIGSVNINQRSVEKDEEVALVVLDRGLVGVLQSHFDADAERCEPATKSDRPSLPERALAKLVLPIRKEM